MSGVPPNTCSPGVGVARRTRRPGPGPGPGDQEDLKASINL